MKNLPEMMKGHSNGHVVEERLSPLRILILRKAQTGSCKNELIIIIDQSERIKEVDSIVNQSEVHAGNGKASRIMDLCLVPSWSALFTTHSIYIYLNTDMNIQ
jgi:hypothetical protein